MRKLKRLTAVALSAAMIFSMSAFQSRATDTELGVKSAAEETAEESESTTEEAEVETTKETEEIETPAETEEPAKETDGVKTQEAAEENGIAVQEEETYLTSIGTLEELQEFVNNVNVKKHDYSGETVVLTGDIDASSINWTPIGDPDRKSYSYSDPTKITAVFRGTFDGQGHTITLNCVDTGVNSYVALFRSNFGTIKNVTVDGSITGSTNIAGITVVNWGTIENCVNKVSVTTNKPAGTTGYAAGICVYSVQDTSGKLEPVSIKNCRNEGTIAGACGAAGIIYWQNSKNGLVSGCVNTGSVSLQSEYTGNAAGICGRAKMGTVENCYNSGAIAGTTNATYNSYYTGGIVGQDEGTSTASTAITVKNCYNTGTITGASSSGKGHRYTGGIIGKKMTPNYTANYSLDGAVDYKTDNETNEASSIVKSETEMKSEEFAAGLGEAYIYNADGYPMLAYEKTEDGSKEYPTEIRNADDLKLFAEGITSGERNYEGEVVTLEADVDVSASTWTPIGEADSEKNLFKGTLDGQNHTITIRVEGSEDYAALFRVNAGTIKNLTVAGSVSGKDYVAGIAARNSGTISGCTNEAEIKSADEETGYAGGIAATQDKDCLIEKCVNRGSVSGGDVAGIVSVIVQTKVYNCMNTGAVTGSVNAGGLVGYVKDAYSAGDRSEVYGCYNLGAVTGTSDTGYTGGLASYIGKSNRIWYAYNAGTVTSPSSNHGAIAGRESGYTKAIYYLDTSSDKRCVNMSPNSINKTDKAMRKAAMVTMLNNGETYYKENPENGYPLLLWQESNGTEKEAVEYIKEIGSVEDLKKFVETVNNGDCDYIGETVVLTKDIDFSAETWTPIGERASDRYASLDTITTSEFFGTFDGQGHTVTLNCNAESGYIAMFRQNYGTIKNLTVAGSVSGTNYVAGIAAINWGAIENCTNKATITATNGIAGGISAATVRYDNGKAKASFTDCSNYADVTGSSNAAGISGHLGTKATTVSGCYNAGTITTSASSSYASGICGNQDSSISGKVNVIENSYNVGTIRSGGYAGGICAYGLAGMTVKNCYSAGIVSGQKYSGAIYGYINGSKYDNNYYLKGTAAGADNKGDTCGTVATRAEMQAEEFVDALGSAYKLNAKGLPLLIRQTENGTEGFLFGDVNGDGKVNEDDALKLMEKIAAEEAMNPLVDDLDGDGMLTNADVYMLMNVIQAP